MGNEQTARVRKAEARRAEWTAGAFYLLAGLGHVAVGLFFDLPAVHWAFIRLGWRLGKWPKFPIPYDVSDYTVPDFGSEFALLAIAMVAAGTLMIAIGVALVHSLIFGCAVLAYWCCGWPRYWHDVRSRLLLRTAWARSARKSWWVWPFLFLVWSVMSQLSIAGHYSFNYMIALEMPFVVGGVVAGVLMFYLLSAQVVRNTVIAEVGPDDLRCMRCGYMLRGLLGSRCPECGSDIDDVVWFRLWRRRWRLPPRLVSWATVAVICALLSAPIWVHMIVINLPSRWQREVPMYSSVLSSSLRRTYPMNPDAFPIRVGAYCVIEKDESIAILQFTDMSMVWADYRTAFWDDKDRMSQGEAPSTSTLGRLEQKYARGPEIGPWHFTHSIGGETMVWLHRPDSSYSVSAFMEDDLPEEYRFIVENWDKWEKR